MMAKKRGKKSITDKNASAKSPPTVEKSLGPFQAILLSRIKGVHELCHAAGNMQHGGTIGDLREFYLRGFLKDFAPTGLTVRSGIVCDHIGMCTRQLDLVVTLDSSLPVLGMRDDVSLIPIESALCYIEIKSRIDTSSLNQMEEQRKSIMRLSPAGTSDPNSAFIFPGMLLGVDPASLSSAAVLEWMKSNQDTVACCVVGEYFVRLNGNETIEMPKSPDGATPFRETLAFMQCFYDSLKTLIEMRKHHPLIGAYLLSGLKQSDFIVRPN